MLIGEVARRSGVSTRMLRHYDSRGLVRPSGRTAGGYREYSEADIRRIFHVESLRALGLSLDEARRALDDPQFSPPALVADLIAQSQQRLAAEEDLLTRLRRIAAAAPDDWPEVLRTVALLRGLGSAQPSARQQAALAGASGAALAPELLAESVLTEAETNVAGTLRWALARTGAQALPTVAAGLRAEQPEVRRRAVTAIADVPGADAARVLREALTDPDDVVRSRAAVALGSRGVRDAVPALLDLVTAGTGDVEAAETLARLAVDAESTQEIVAALVGNAAGAAPGVRRRVVQALAEIPGRDAERALRTFCADPDRGVALPARAILHRR